MRKKIRVSNYGEVIITSTVGVIDLMVAPSDGVNMTPAKAELIADTLMAASRAARGAQYAHERRRKAKL